jgi:mitochondrial fission protein ELM1
LDPASIASLLARAVNEQQIKISLHTAEEALAEHITRHEIETAMLDVQVLEDYPDWWLGPSCLVYGQTETGRDLHLVVSCP